MTIDNRLREVRVKLGLSPNTAPPNLGFQPMLGEEEFKDRVTQIRSGNQAVSDLDWIHASFNNGRYDGLPVAELTQLANQVRTYYDRLSAEQQYQRHAKDGDLIVELELMTMPGYQRSA